MEVPHESANRIRLRRGSRGDHDRFGGFNPDEPMKIEYVVVFGGTLGCLGASEWARFDSKEEAERWIESEPEKDNLSVQSVEVDD
jgi:hypothetical protein